MRLLIKKLLLVYIGLIFVFISGGQLILENGVLTRASVSCQAGECSVSESFISGKIIRSYTFEQADIKEMWLKEDLRGYYHLWSSFDKIKNCLNCGNLQLIRLPFDWWWKANVQSFISKLETEENIDYFQYNRLFSWLFVTLASATVLILVLYKCGKITVNSK